MSDPRQLLSGHPSCGDQSASPSRTLPHEFVIASRLHRGSFPSHGVLVGNKLYVGNLPYSFSDSDMAQAFGAVQSAKIVMDRDSGRSKGFGFVEMGSEAEAKAAIEGMNGHEFDGRALVVNEARPMEPRSGGPRRSY